MSALAKNLSAIHGEEMNRLMLARMAGGVCGLGAIWVPIVMRISHRDQSGRR
jgi:hypothetical protein